MQMKRAVVVKVIVTEKFKEETTAQLEEAIRQVEQTKSQLDFRSRIRLTELQRIDLTQAAEFRRMVEAEKRRQEELREQLAAELEETRALQIGEETARGTLEGFVEVAVGDHLSAKLSQAEIVVKDDVVVELREPQSGA